MALQERFRMSAEADRRIDERPIAARWLKLFDDFV